MATQVGFEFRDDHEVPLARLDVAAATGAQVALPGGVGLDGGHDLYAVAAHSTNTTAIRMDPITMATSTAVFRCARKGLNPMRSW